MLLYHMMVLYLISYYSYAHLLFFSAPKWIIFHDMFHDQREWVSCIG